jgi:hypothetical protein
MPNKPVPSRVNLLSQAEVPDRGSQQAPPLDYPVNLYKPSQPQGHRSPTRPSPEVLPLVKSAAPRPHPEPYRPTPTPASRQQAAEARAIAQRVHDRSRSSRLEYLLSRQQSKRYSHYERQQPKRELEHLAIARRPDGCFQIVIRSTQTAFSRYVFETAGHCEEAAVELEQRFALGPVLEGMVAEMVEAVEGIVLAAVLRERVSRGVRSRS